MIRHRLRTRQIHAAERVRPHSSILGVATGTVIFLLTGWYPSAAQVPDSLAYPDWQIEIVDLSNWDTDLVVTLSASQASYNNWTEGGVSTLASTSTLTGQAIRTTRNWTQTFESRLGIGIVKQDTLNVRKAEDILRLTATSKYQGEGFFRSFNPTAAAGIRTQFAPGFNYNSNPFADGRNPPVKVSDLFSPATFTQSLGLTYGSKWGLRQRLGIAMKETVVLIERFRMLYGVNPTGPVRFQLGVESFTEFDKEVLQNVLLKSSLGLFAAFNQDELPDMLWENVIVMKVNNWLSADFEFVALFDRDLSDRIQLKEALSIGFSFVII